MRTLTSSATMHSAMRLERPLIARLRPRSQALRGLASIVLAAFLAVGANAPAPLAGEGPSNPVLEAAQALRKMKVRLADSPQEGVSHYRNNVSAAALPVDWD